MSLMKLSPESGRLRQVVKAYAAGEMSLEAYRDIRADVVDQFATAGSGDALEDATEQRRKVNNSHIQPLQINPRGTRRHRYLLWAVGILLLFFCGVISQSSHAVQLIPGVDARDPNPATSMRLDIDALYISNFEVIANADLTVDAVDKFLADELSGIEQQIQPGSHGFTQREMTEIGKLLQSMSVHSRASSLSETESRALMTLIHGQQARRGPSLVQLEQVAENLAQFYRSHGIPLAVAYIPAQTVERKVAFSVLPGQLAKVDIEGAAHRPGVLIDKQFSDLVGKFVTETEVESALYLVNDLAGVDVQANFNAGENVGDTQLALTLNVAQPFSAIIRVDNDGDKYTGRQRSIARVNWHGPFGIGDSLEASVLQSWNPNNSSYGYIDYQFPVFDLATTLNVGISNSNFDFDDLSEQLDGDTRAAQVTIKRVMRRSRRHSWNWQLGNSWQSLKLKSVADNGMELENQKFWYLLAAVENELTSDVYKTRSDIRFELNGGDISDSTFPDQKHFFWRARLDSTFQKLVVLPGLASEQELNISLVAQYSQRPLPASLEMGLGGANRVRGFDRSDFSAESGIFLGSELRIFPQQPQYGAFLLLADFALGKQKFVGEYPGINGGMASVGMGWDVTLLNGLLHGKLRWSVPLASSDSIQNDGHRIIWMMEYQIK
ncbi:MAG: hypothetical protein KUG75_01790 [Pseudomonadales bacterium]|nr:hypothetical protein [Pseudomonadales bacterium]